MKVVHRIFTLTLIYLIKSIIPLETELDFEDDGTYHKYTIYAKKLINFVRPIDFHFDFNIDRVHIRSRFNNTLNVNYSLHRDSYFNSDFFDKTLYFLNVNRAGFLPLYRVYKTRTYMSYCDCVIEIKLPKSSLDYVRRILIGDKELETEQPELFLDREYGTRKFLNKVVLYDEHVYKTKREAVEKNRKNFDKFNIKY